MFLWIYGIAYDFFRKYAFFDKNAEKYPLFSIVLILDGLALFISFKICFYTNPLNIPELSDEIGTKADIFGSVHAGGFSPHKIDQVLFIFSGVKNIVTSFIIFLLSIGLFS